MTFTGLRFLSSSSIFCARGVSVDHLSFCRVTLLSDLTGIVVHTVLVGLPTHTVNNQPLPERIGKKEYNLNTEKEYDGAADIEAVNSRFNEELQQYIDGTLPTNIRFDLGFPTGSLASQIANIPLYVKQGIFKKAIEKHKIDLSELKNLPKQLADPILIFNSKNGTSKIVLIDAKDTQGRNIIAAIEFSIIKIDAKRELEVNDIKSLHGKDFEKLLHWIDNGLLAFVNKKKGLDFLIRNRAQFPSGDGSQNPIQNTLLNIIKEFEKINT